MDIPAISPTTQIQYATKVEKVSQDAAKQEGEAALELIEAAAPDAPPAPDGRGRILNTVA